MSDEIVKRTLLALRLALPSPVADSVEAIVNAEISRLRADLAAARAEVERLTRERDEARAALRGIMGCWGRDGNGRENLLDGPGLYRALSAARRVLAQDPGTTGGSGEGGT